MEVDRDLIRQARRFITGANVHYVETWVLGYELSAAGSPPQARYEGLLREFVSSRARLTSMQARVESNYEMLTRLDTKSAALCRRVDALLKKAA